MEEKRSFPSAFLGMFKGAVKPIEYVENGRCSSWFSAFLVILIISLIVPFITVFLPLNNLYGNDRLAEKVDDKLPDFVLTEQGFSCIGASTWTDDSGLYFSIDTKVNMVDEDTIQDIVSSGNYNTIVVVARKNIFLYSVDYNDGEAVYIEWSEIYEGLKNTTGYTSYSKSQILSGLKKWDTPVIVIIYAIVALITFVIYYIVILFWGMLGLAFNNKKAAGLTFGELCKMAVYIRAPWYIIRKLLGYFVFYNAGTMLWILAFIIITIYMYAAISSYTKKLQDDEGMREHMQRIQDYTADTTQ